MVEVFKTNVLNREQSVKVLNELCCRFPEFRANFDLEDIDKILRIESERLDSIEIVNHLALMGFECKVLEDVVQ